MDDLSGSRRGDAAIRLGTQVSCVAYRNPVLLARMAADIDAISHGRLVLGLGSGDMPREFQQMGLAYPTIQERQVALEEAIGIIRPLLRGETVTFAGTHYRAEGAVLRPLVQQPYIPLLIAGGGERTTLRYVAQYADMSSMAGASWAGGSTRPLMSATSSRACSAAVRRLAVPTDRSSAQRCSAR